MKNKKIFYYITIGLIFLFGLYIRTKLYILSDYFEDDECRLGIVLQGRHFWQIFTPIGPLSCTPIFLGISKIIAEISHYNEYALRFLPFAFSIGSLFLFYKICKEYFVRKISICLAMFLFTVNKYAIHFSSIFKTYSLEILITLLCLYYFPKIDTSKLNKKQLILLSGIITLLPLISLPSLYFIGIFILIEIYKIIKNKASIKPLISIIIPLITVFGYYYFVTLAPTKVMQLEAYPELWGKSLSAPLVSVMAVFIHFLNEPNTAILSVLLLIFSFIVYAICDKKEHTLFNIYLILCFILSVFGSYFGLYPLTIGRTALFLLPVIILIPIKMFDILKPKTVLFFITCLLILISYYKYCSLSYFSSINDVIPTFRNYEPKILMKDMKSKFNFDTDKVITTESSLYSYIFYAYKENFPPKSLDNDSIEVRKTKENVYNYLNNLNPNKNYWFYLIKDYEKEPLRKYMKDWILGQKVIYSRQENNSYLYYINGAVPQKL